MSFCSPRQLRSKKKKASTKSCLDEETIDDMVHLYNSKEKKPVILTSQPSESKLKILLDELKSEMPCKEEYCLAYSNTMNSIKKKLMENFRPEIPTEWKTNKKTWLNTNDILASLNQYEEAFKDFKFLSVSPIDFDTRLNEKGIVVETGGTCVDRSLCAVNLLNLLKTKFTRIGAVFNLDKHDESGSHWTAMFADLLLGEFYYYDSVANGIPDEVIDLADRFVSQGNALILNGTLTIEQQSSAPKLSIKNGKITISEICDYLMQNNNFVLYRYAYLFPVEQRFQIKTDVVSKEIASKIVGDVLGLIDKTEQERYANIDDLDKLSKHIKGNSVSMDDFIFDWVNANLTIAINNLMDSLKVVQTTSFRTRVADIQFSNNAFHITCENPNAAKTTVSDMSCKAFSNFVQHQFKNTECGMYSINFIDNFLFKNKTFIEIINNPINDTNMNEMRYSKYFLSV